MLSYLLYPPVDGHGNGEHSVVIARVAELAPPDDPLLRLALPRFAVQRRKRSSMHQRLTCLLAVFALAVSLHAQPTDDAKEKESKYGEKTFAGLELRELGPALTSGRIIDLAVDPRDARVWYIATAGGGVWKTTNAGPSFTPIFDKEKSFSIGCGTLDPRGSPLGLGGAGGK